VYRLFSSGFTVEHFYSIAKWIQIFVRPLEVKRLLLVYVLRWEDNTKMGLIEGAYFWIAWILITVRPSDRFV